MTIDQWLRAAYSQLTDAGIGTARLDAVVLLEDALHTDRAQLLAHPEIELGTEQISILSEQLSRRISHLPLAYIRGKTEFYGREFLINNYVLEPRPETEMMIDLLKRLPESARQSIADIGTGSGALAITAQLELNTPKVYAIDIDRRCLELATRNAKRLNATITTLYGNLYEPLAEQNSAKSTKPGGITLLCNLPYVPDNFHINMAAAHEPRLAIFGGPDGLDLYREMFIQIEHAALKPRFILSEALPPQHEELVKIAALHGYKNVGSDDFIQTFQEA